MQMNDEYSFMNNVQNSYELRNNIKTFYFYPNEFRRRLFKKICDFILMYDEIYKISFVDFMKLNIFCFFIIVKKKFSNEQIKTMHENENSSLNQTKIIIKNRNDMKNIANFQKQNFLKIFTMIDKRNDMKKIDNIETHCDMKNVKIIIESIN